jgi:16S rRNA (cytidine1402-2'-O)-methyltransferase
MLSTSPTISIGWNGELMNPGLYITATPIGNLEDITQRALTLLRSADLIACEDTRKTARLLARYLIRVRTVSYFEQSPPSRVRQILDAVRSGKVVALVSEAGTPTVSDPGARLVSEAHKQGLPVYAIPGASSVTAALSISGFPAGRFIFEGFPPRRPGRLRKLLKDLAAQDRTVVLFESPHRIRKTLQACLETFGDREGAIVREVTKLHEEVVRGSLSRLLEAVQKPRGEYTLIISGRAS